MIYNRRRTHFFYSHFDGYVFQLFSLMVFCLKGTETKQFRESESFMMWERENSHVFSDVRIPTSRNEEASENFQMWEIPIRFPDVKADMGISHNRKFFLTSPNSERFYVINQFQFSFNVMATSTIITAHENNSSQKRT